MEDIWMVRLNDASKDQIYYKVGPPTSYKLEFWSPYKWPKIHRVFLGLRFHPTYRSEFTTGPTLERHT